MHQKVCCGGLGVMENRLFLKPKKIKIVFLSLEGFCPSDCVLLRVKRCWCGLARCFRMLSGSSNRWVVVRLVGSSSSVRNSRVSGGWMAWVCKLLAQRNELQALYPFHSPSPSMVICLVGKIGILCVLPIELNSIVFISLFGRFP